MAYEQSDDMKNNAQNRSLGNDNEEYNQFVINKSK